MIKLTRKQYEIEEPIQVTDENGKGIEGIVFKVTNIETDENTFVTNKDGYIDTRKFEQSQYILKEINVPIKYEQTQVYYVMNPEQDLEIKHIEKKGDAWISIMDENKHFCSNCSFNLYKDKQQVSVVITDEKGTLYVTDLSLGTYSLEYLGDEQYDIVDDDLTFHITPYNYNATLQLTYYLSKSANVTINRKDVLSIVFTSICCISIAIVFMLHFRKDDKSSEDIDFSNNI